MGSWACRSSSIRYGRSSKNSRMYCAAKSAGVIDPEVLPHVPKIEVRSRSVAEMRAVLAAAAAMVHGCPVHRVVDRVIPGAAGLLPARLYYPNETSSQGLIVSLHGGGWCSGGLETHDAICRY